MIFIDFYVVDLYNDSITWLFRTCMRLYFEISGDFMKVSKVLIEDRRNRLLTILKEHEISDTQTLANELGCSLATVRRDLNFLAAINLINKKYGNISLVNHLDAQQPAGTAAHFHDIDIAKRQIAQYAASLVKDGDVLFINTSETALHIIEYITAKSVTVITNNANAIMVDRAETTSVILTGGELRHPKASMVGDYAIRNLMGMVASKSFVGCSGLSTENGMTTANANEVALNQLMLERVTGNAYILADHTKFGKVCAFSTCPIEKITNIITDADTPEKAIESFECRGIKVLTA